MASAPFSKSFETPFGIILITEFTTAAGMATIGSPECRMVRIDQFDWVLYNENDSELGRIRRASVIGYLRMLPKPEGAQ